MQHMFARKLTVKGRAHCRRFAVGIDIAPAGVRAIVASRSLRTFSDVFVEYVGYSDLPPGTVESTGIADPDAVAAAIVKALEAFAHHRVATGLRAVMALPLELACLTFLPLTESDGTEPGISAHDVSDVALHRKTLAQKLQHGMTQPPPALTLDSLEPAVRAHAEDISWMERSVLAVDWHRSDTLGPSGHLTIAAAAQQRVDIYIEAAAGAGLHLIAVDIEPLAALRACIFDAVKRSSALAGNLQQSMISGSPIEVVWSELENILRCPTFEFGGARAYARPDVCDAFFARSGQPAMQAIALGLALHGVSI